MRYAVSSTELREGRQVPACWVKLSTLIRQYLVRLAVLVDAILQEVDSTFPRAVVVDLAAWNKSNMIVQLGDHPFVLICKLEVPLP